MIVSKESFVSFPLEKVAFVGRFTVPVPKERLSAKGHEAIESVTAGIQKIFPGLQPTVDLDEDGDWEILSKSPENPNFRLDLGSKVFGGLFENVEKLSSVIEAITVHAETSLDMLSSKPRQLLLQFQTVFQMTGDVTNHNVFEESLLPDWTSSPFAKLISAAEDWGRFDVKLSLDLDSTHRAFASVEMPANREHRTIWFELTVATIEERPLRGSATEHVKNITSVAHDFYQHRYADFVTAIIGDRDVERNSND